MIPELNLWAGLLAFVVTGALFWVLKPLAHRLDLLDHPKGRKDHAAPTPVTGGVAVFLGSLIVFFVVERTSPYVHAFAAASLLLVIAGLWDDKYDLRWYWRILVQIVAGLIIVYMGNVRIEQLGSMFGLGDTDLGALSVPFTVFATVGLINAVNMIDGADGLAGSLGLAALVMFTAAAMYAGNVPLANRIFLLVGALAGFLVWNIRLPWRARAHAFLGNAGSAFLGLVIAWVCFRLTQNPNHPVNPVLALWLLPIPVMDCLVLIARRLRERRSPFTAGQDHIHHLMQAGGFGPTRAAMWLTLFSFVVGLLAAQAMRMDVPNSVLLGAFGLLCIGWYLLSARRDRAVSFFRALNGVSKPDVAESDVSATVENVKP